MTWENDDCVEYETDLPAKNEVCPRCDGEGSHVNPSIDGNGITAGEWDELCHDDPDFPEDYTGGLYDVTCEECHGRNVVAVIDEGEIERSGTAEQKSAFAFYCEAARDRAEDRRTREMECRAERGY